MASGVGQNVALAKVHFKLSKTETEIVIPNSLTASGANTIIRVMAPKAMSSKYTSVNVQYDKWVDNASSVINVKPHVSNASIDMDRKILVIKGYGFSIVPRENVITYKYADENKTEITPRVKYLGVYPTEEGQEIRIKILDNYHYGFVSVRVGEQQSNEANFGPTSIRKIARRLQYVESEDREMGVLYISGYNFGQGDVLVGETVASVHYRTDFFIIAVVEPGDLYNDPVVVTKE